MGISSKEYLPVVRWMWSEWARWSHDLVDPSPKELTSSSIVDTSLSRVTGDIEPSDDYYIIQRLIPELDPVYFKIMRLKYLHRKSNFMMSVELHKSETSIQDAITFTLHMTWGSVKGEKHVEKLREKIRRKN